MPYDPLLGYHTHDSATGACTPNPSWCSGYEKRQKPRVGPKVGNQRLVLYKQNDPRKSVRARASTHGESRDRVGKREKRGRRGNSSPKGSVNDAALHAALQELLLTRRTDGDASTVAAPAHCGTYPRRQAAHRAVPRTAPPERPTNTYLY